MRTNREHFFVPKGHNTNAINRHCLMAEMCRGALSNYESFCLLCWHQYGFSVILTHCLSNLLLSSHYIFYHMHRASVTFHTYLSAIVPVRFIFIYIQCTHRLLSNLIL